MIPAPCRLRCLVVLAAAALAACHQGGDSSTAAPSVPAAPPAAEATPVRTARVALADLSETVSAPGRTEALVRQQVRAPFAGTLTSLTVVVGDTVTEGERVGALVARDTEAALNGAETMLRDARTPADRADAERALELARANQVVTPLRSSVTGLVVARTAAAGDRVAEDQELLAVASRSSLVFVADLAQSELGRVEAGQSASIALAGQSSPLAGTVHGILATANPAALTAPIRIDPASPGRIDAIGLFGTVRITVSRRTNVPAVPASAVLTDDVSGTKQLALIEDGKAHWVQVQTGLTSAGLVEITAPKLAPGTEVITSGQVGLPEGAPVVSGP